MSQTITRSKVAISTGIPDSMNEARLLRRKVSIALTSEGIELRYVMKAIFLFLLLAGCASEDANISHGPPAVPTTDEELSSDGEDATVIADDEVTQPASAQGDDSNVDTQSRNAYTASANDQNYDTQRQYQQQQDDNTRRFYHNQDLQRQYHNQDLQRYYQQQRQNTFDTRRGVQPLPLPRH